MSELKLWPRDESFDTGYLPVMLCKGLKRKGNRSSEKEQNTEANALCQVCETVRRKPQRWVSGEAPFLPMIIERHGLRKN